MFNRIRIGKTRAWGWHGRVMVATAALLASWSLTSRAIVIGDAVMEWNQIAFAATVTAGQGPLPQARSMTIVQVSVHDAVNSLTGKHKTYLAHGQPPAAASADAAAIAAAHRALVSLFPSQSTALDAYRAASLAARGLSDTNSGVAWGEIVAGAILAARSNDGAAQAQFPYTAPGAGAPGVWVPIGAAAPLLPGWGNVAPWVITRGSQFRPDGPPALTSARYARDYNEIKELGSLTSLIRKPEQTEIARFWLATPSAIWNRVAREILEVRSPDLSDTARTLALMYIAASDAGIACWDAKYVFNNWRPLTAIRNGHLDGNNATDVDPNWQSLFPAPQHPEYISGHSTNSSAMAAMLGFIFGDNPGVPIVAISPTNPGFARVWGTFSQGVNEVIEARIYSGIHFRTSDEVGARVGQRAALFVFMNALQ